MLCVGEVVIVFRVVDRMAVRGEDSRLGVEECTARIGEVGEVGVSLREVVERTAVMGELLEFAATIGEFGGEVECLNEFSFRGVTPLARVYKARTGNAEEGRAVRGVRADEGSIGAVLTPARTVRGIRSLR